MKAVTEKLNGDAVAAAPSPSCVLRAQNLVKNFGEGTSQVRALRGCDISLRAGEITAVIGASGSGKSTLLHLLCGLDEPSEGSIEIDGRQLGDVGSKERARWRAEDIGIVLQRDNLIPSLSLRENVAAPMLLSAKSRSAALDRAEEMLGVVGLSHRVNRWPAEVSGGEAQRAAVARACAGSPRLIFADEPTGSLDSDSGATVLELFQALVRHCDAATLLVTHDPNAAEIADRRLRMSDGHLDMVP